MAAGKLKLAIEQGATFRKLLTYKGRYARRRGERLTGCTARAQIRSAITSPTVLVNLTTENGGIVLGGVAGTIELIITDTATAAITWTTGVYDLEIVFPSGDVRRLVYPGP